MQTKDFMRSHLWDTNGVEKYCASVMSDGHGNIYSYGYHYPLLVKVNGKHFLNTAGYSSTTGKHISWAYSLADYVYNYRFSESGERSDTRPPAIKKCIENEIADNGKRLASLSDRVFRQKENLQNRNDDLRAGLNYLQDVPAQSKGNNLKSENNDLKTVAMIASLGEIFCDNQKGKNDWKARMLKAGLENKGLIMPDDWNELTEDEKEKRLDGAIACL